MQTAKANSPLLISNSPDGATQTATKNSQSPGAATGTTAPKPTENSAPISPPPPRKAGTTMSWGAPAGLPIPSNNNENLLIFRKALGINMHRDAADASGTLEEGRKTAIGIYRSVIETQTRMVIQHGLLTAFLYLVYFAQIIIGAALTALGATASHYERVITILGAFNTVLAGVLALIKGSGQPQKLGKDRIGYRRLQDWIEETEALLAVGVIGRNRKEVGLLVESAFKRYNAAKVSEENNDPEFYVYHQQEPLGNRPSDDGRNEQQVAK
ncbi:hypothetical protein EKO27_g11264 [Xylaria grammica]|uniref:SMODS and SLOG-associating 2TM effector domain-containing protein n=1 Tax=Xylaria grammica TaxID=363999 RepID=A0A439CNV5_9PEZI|nr:hypothetical protein EKO27_g11264 [Xylaria grammica]